MRHDKAPPVKNVTVSSVSLFEAGADPLSLKLRGTAKDGQDQPSLRAGHVRMPPADRQVSRRTTRTHTVCVKR